MELFYIRGNIAPCNYLSFHRATPLLPSPCEVFCNNAHVYFLKPIRNLVTSIHMQDSWGEIYLEHQISLILYPDYGNKSLVFIWPAYWRKPTVTWLIMMKYSTNSQASTRTIFLSVTDWLDWVMKLNHWLATTPEYFVATDDKWSVGISFIFTQILCF